MFDLKKKKKKDQTWRFLFFGGWRWSQMISLPSLAILNSFSLYFCFYLLYGKGLHAKVIRFLILEFTIPRLPIVPSDNAE